jgi:hypothetical protein
MLCVPAGQFLAGSGRSASGEGEGKADKQDIPVHVGALVKRAPWKGYTDLLAGLSRATVLRRHQCWDFPILYPLRANLAARMM